MLDREFPIPFDKDMTRVAISLILLGAVFIRLAGWPVAGWVMVAFGMVVLWLAHEFAVAPRSNEPAQVP